MTPTANYSIGVDIGSKTIKFCHFNLSGTPYLKCQFEVPTSAMPGAVKIALCEKIESIDPNRLADFAGVSVLGEIDLNGRIIKTCSELPGWIDVPLADCLEPRLSRKVNLFSSAKSSVAGRNDFVNGIRIDHDILYTLGDSLFDLERFNSFIDAP